MGRSYCPDYRNLPVTNKTLGVSTELTSGTDARGRAIKNWLSGLSRIVNASAPSPIICRSGFSRDSGIAICRRRRSPRLKPLLPTGRKRCAGSEAGPKGERRSGSVQAGPAFAAAATNENAASRRRFLVTRCVCQRSSPFGAACTLSSGRQMREPTGMRHPSATACRSRCTANSNCCR